MKTSEHIKELLDRYYSGKSSLSEEMELTEFFAINQDLGELEPHRCEFLYSDSLHEIKLNESLKNKISNTFMKRKSRLLLNKKWMGIAASVLFAFIGFGVGKFSNQPIENEMQLTELRTEINSLKTMMMVTLMNQPKASDRLKGIRIAAQLYPENMDETITVLTKTISEDENTNVRIASVNALYDFQEPLKTKEILIRLLTTQDSPMVQMELLRVIQNLKLQITEEDIIKIFNNTKIDSEVRNSIKNLTI
ncbi:HEAT repeat domain-containing protein [Maribacter sp. IgM3_T14_3]|uniref:HEAT repeat domain-containing protein n=1 Tax=Maribacter sp. IgM3_T14_3 TaxID=3415140 RepID=UPI003C6F3BE9